MKMYKAAIDYSKSRKEKEEIGEKLHKSELDNDCLLVGQNLEYNFQ